MLVCLPLALASGVHLPPSLLRLRGGEQSKPGSMPGAAPPDGAPPLQTAVDGTTSSGRPTMSSMSAAVPSNAYLPVQDPWVEDGTLAIQQAFAQSLAQAWPAQIRMELDPAKYRSSSQGPDRGLPVSLGEIERVIDRVTKTDGWMPIIPQYQGATRWARSAWKGTILEHLWIPAAWSFLIPLLMIVAAKVLVPSAAWLPSPQPEHPLFATLLALSHGWVHLLTLTTFTTTFFLGHAHAFWNKCYLLSRVIQGRLNDVGMLCGSHAARTADGLIDPEAAAVLTQVQPEPRTRTRTRTPNPNPEPRTPNPEPRTPNPEPRTRNPNPNPNPDH
jgi:hypothetical protein